MFSYLIACTFITLVIPRDIGTKLEVEVAGDVTFYILNLLQFLHDIFNLLFKATIEIVIY